MVSNIVRFYYDEEDGKTFRKLAFDDYALDEADAHEALLKKQKISYIRINNARIDKLGNLLGSN